LEQARERQGTIEIDRGERDGIHRNQPVIHAGWARGQGDRVYRDSAQCCCLTDKDSGVGAMLVESRIQARWAVNWRAILLNDDSIVGRDDTGERGRERS